MTRQSKTKPPKALDAANGHERNAPAGALAIGHKGQGIAALAQELADLQKLSFMMVNAEGPAKRAQAKASAEHSQELSKCSAMVNDIEAVGRRAHTMTAGLEHLILGLEPATADETLSLALVLAVELDVFLSDHVNHDDSRIDADMRCLDAALQAVIRGLVRGAGAQSPLLDAYANAATLVPWDEARSRATRGAAPYMVEYNPAAGRLKPVCSAARETPQ